MTTLPTTAGKSQRAYEWIRERIARREYGPGHRLVLQTIGDELGMSVVPVREAIRRLEAEGVVTFERNVGARVSLVDEGEYLRTMQALAILEGAATALAAPFLSEDDLTAALALNEQMKQQFGRFDPAEVAALNHRFHATLTARCPNGDLLVLADNLWTRLANVRDESHSFTEAGAHESVLEHERLIGLIRDGADPYEIERLMREHRLRASAAFLTGHQHAEQP
jgi:DNA-binding GntR family transcriptional regulator